MQSLRFQGCVWRCACLACLRSWVQTSAPNYMQAYMSVYIHLGALVQALWRSMYMHVCFHICVWESWYMYCSIRVYIEG